MGIDVPEYEFAWAYRKFPANVADAAHDFLGVLFPRARLRARRAPHPHHLRTTTRGGNAVVKRWWITLYGLYGTSFMPLDNVSVETLRECLTGQREYKLEQYTQEERNALAFSGGRE